MQHWSATKRGLWQRSNRAAEASHVRSRLQNAMHHTSDYRVKIPGDRVSSLSRRTKEHRPPVLSDPVLTTPIPNV